MGTWISHIGVQNAICKFKMITYFELNLDAPYRSNISYIFVCYLPNISVFCSCSQIIFIIIFFIHIHCKVKGLRLGPPEAHRRQQIWNKNVKDQHRHEQVKLVRFPVKENNHQSSISPFSGCKHSSYRCLHKQLKTSSVQTGEPTSAYTRGREGNLQEAWGIPAHRVRLVLMNISVTRGTDQRANGLPFLGESRAF